MTDLEAAGLEATAVLTPSTGVHDSAKDSIGKKGGPKRAPRTAKGIKKHLERLRSIPTLTADDKTVFYCNECVVGKLELEGARKWFAVPWFGDFALWSNSYCVCVDGQKTDR